MFALSRKVLFLQLRSEMRLLCQALIGHFCKSLEKLQALVRSPRSPHGPCDEAHEDWIGADRCHVTEDINAMVKMRVWHPLFF